MELDDRLNDLITDSRSNATNPNFASTSNSKKVKDGADKKGKVLMTSVSMRYKEAITPNLTKGVSKAPILSRRDMFEQGVDDKELINLAAENMKAVCETDYGDAIPQASSPASEELRPCLAVKSASETPCLGTALRLGISSTSSGWNLQGFVEASQLETKHVTLTACLVPAVQFLLVFDS